MLNDERQRPRQTFRKRERIRTRHDISRVFDTGRRVSVPGMRLHVLPTGQSETRAVFVTVRKYGNAVQRNRARRVVSECWRLLKAEVQPGNDVVILIYPADDSLERRKPQLEALVRRAGLGRS